MVRNIFPSILDFFFRCLKCQGKTRANSGWRNSVNLSTTRRVSLKETHNFTAYGSNMKRAVRPSKGHEDPKHY
ncbi:hypothetical protein ACHQM5_022859 [Ranunculus cassubicifolius]